MAELGKHNPEFNIAVSLNGQTENLVVKPQETSDGVEFFLCFKGEKQLTQVRQEAEDKWEQMWGELPDNEVEAIGQAITKKTQDDNS